MEQKEKVLAIPLPEWAEERHVFVMAGAELVAFKPAGKNELWIKTSRCIKCGWCCENVFKSGPCEELRQYGGEKLCRLGSKKPFACAWSDPKITKPKGMEKCNIEYRIVEL